MENTNQTKPNQKPTFIAIAVIAVLVLGGVGVLAMNMRSSEQQNPITSIIAEAETQIYTEYSKEKLAQNSDGTNVIFFHASWCPDCRKADKILKEELSNLPANTQFLKVNYDTATQLKQKYGITMQSSYVKVDSNGNMLAKTGPLGSIEEMINFVKSNEQVNMIEKEEGDSKVGDANDDKVMIKEEINQPEKNQITAESNNQPAIYTEYSKEKLAQNKGGTNIIFFHASWCPDCRKSEATIKQELANLPKGLQFLKTDFDTSTDLRKKYGITIQDTFVKVDSEGNKIDMTNGLKDIDQILTFIK